MTSTPPVVQIGDRLVGADHPCYVVAELSGNHHDDLGEARALVEAAAEAGADAVKLQTYTADGLTLDVDAPPFRIGAGTLWSGRTLHDLYQEAMTPWSWLPELRDVADRCGLHLFSSPFDAAGVEFLAEHDVPAYKIASFEIVDHDLVRRAASKGRPVIISTGMATAEEIDEAVAVAMEGGAAGVVLLRCTSAYPAPPESMDLRTIPDMARRWSAPIGLSDHTMGVAAAIAAVALGACMLEKHLILDRASGGPDAGFSLEPAELAATIAAVREAEAALGDVRYGPSPEEEPSRVFRRSLFVVEDVARGEAFTERNVRSIRPGDGMAPKRLPEVLTRRAAVTLRRGTPLAEEHLA